MAKILGTGNVSVTATMEFNETELRALEALVGYSDQAFLKSFYENLGTSYMKPHEEGLLSVFASIRKEVPHILRRTTAARDAFGK